MGSKFCMQFQRAPLRFHTKFWTHTSQHMHFTDFIFLCDLRCLGLVVISFSDTTPWWPYMRAIELKLDADVWRFAPTQNQLLNCSIFISTLTSVIWTRIDKVYLWTYAFEGDRGDKIIKLFLIIIKGLKVQHVCQFWPENRSWHQINSYAILHNALNLPKWTIFDSYIRLYNKLGCCQG